MLDIIIKKPLGEYSLYEIIDICNAKKLFCENCPLSSLCNIIPIPHIKHFYKEDLEKIIYFNSNTGEISLENADKNN